MHEHMNTHTHTRARNTHTHTHARARAQKAQNTHNTQNPTPQFEIVMREGNMAPMVLAVAPPKPMRTLGKATADVKDFTTRVDLPQDRFPLWPGGGGGSAKELVAHCESQALFIDLFGDARVQQIIGKDPLVAKHLK